jgi:hypothetical protein
LETLNCDGVSEADLLQLLDSAHRRSDGENLATRIHQGASQSLESRGLAGAGRAADTDRTVPRLKDKLHCLLLLGAQTVEDDRRVRATERLECAKSAVDGSNHVSFALQSHRCCDLAARPQDLARGFLQIQFALQVGKPDSPSAMPQGLGE